MRVLIVGSGGREHALAWKLAQSPKVQELFVAPGNGGTGKQWRNVDIGAEDVDALTTFAQEKQVDLTVVGPEAPLVAGLVDAFESAGLRAFGPCAAAAQLEGSKAMAKRFMIEEGIPTAPAAIFGEVQSALLYLRQVEPPVVVKASGLAAGKGVLVCTSRDEAEAALKAIMVDKVFGAAGNEVLIETFLTGEEVSLMAFCDGHSVSVMPPARDYKRALDGDRGGNTGGMGGFAPSPMVSPRDIDGLVRRVLQPTVDGMRRRGVPYVGVLYAGLMLTASGPRVLEFNCRFGDPETQLVMPLLESDLLEVMLACLEGRLAACPITWRKQATVGIVLASGGYPGAYETGKRITGTEDAGRVADAVFHAGTVEHNGELRTTGGRVLTVVAGGDDLSVARSRVYEAAQLVRFDGMHFRTDIAAEQASKATGLVTDSPGCGSAYEVAGVDIDSGERAVQLMKEAVQSTFTPSVLGGIGAFGGSLALDHLGRLDDLVMVASTDGVGTKTLIAASMGIYDTVGQDIVNHCVNDVLVQGARPLFFLDYIASAKLDPTQVASVVGGCARACREVGCVLLGGETAEMPGVYLPGTFDLAGTLVGWVRRGDLLDGGTIAPGDVCVGLSSSGLHTNGYSLARHVFRHYGWDTRFPELNASLGETLLTPHRAYLRQLEKLWSQGIGVKGMAHLTGGAFVENIPRVLPSGVGVVIDRAAWQVPPIFHLIQSLGSVDEREMYRVFNMGIGMVLFLADTHVDKAIATLPGEAVTIGRAVAWDGSQPRVQLWT